MVDIIICSTNWCIIILLNSGLVKAKEAYYSQIFIVEGRQIDKRVGGGGKSSGNHERELRKVPSIEAKMPTYGELAKSTRC